MGGDHSIRPFQNEKEDSSKQPQLQRGMTHTASLASPSAFKNVLEGCRLTHNDTLHEHWMFSLLSKANSPPGPLRRRAHLAALAVGFALRLLLIVLSVGRERRR